MNILVVGSGGREHALVWKIRKSPQVKKIYCAPGNGGIAQMAECVAIKPTDIPGLLKFSKDHQIGLVVVGPEAPLAEGLADVLESAGIAVFGPSKAAAQLEASKVFAKEFMRRHQIPTAEFQTFQDVRRAHEYLKKAEYPLVVKADGLSGGKGVVICKTIAEAEGAIKTFMVERVFSEAGDKIIIEECLEGEEVSIFAISDGQEYVILDSSQDHKRIFDDDLGPNTGGMGAYSPALLLNKDLWDEIEESIIAPTIIGMRQEGLPFRGVLYAGLMITKDGPKTLEYNVRFGDPEAQALLPRLKNDLVEVMFAACEGRVGGQDLIWDDRECVCVVITSGGYPKEFQTGYEIKGLEEAAKCDDVTVFHAATKKEGDQFLTDGGRVLGVTGLGRGILDAIHKTYQAVETIKFEHAFFRRDIGAKALRHVKIGGRL